MMGRCIGINTGSGERFAGKRLTEDQIMRLARAVYDKWGMKALLLGGPEEAARNKRLEQQIRGIAVNTGTHHTIHQFAGLVAQCAVVVTGDTIAMHIAIAMKVQVLVYFGSTCAQEIELYGRGSKIITDIDCAPCYKSKCPIDDKCMSDISVDQLMQGISGLLR